MREPVPEAARLLHRAAVLTLADSARKHGVGTHASPGAARGQVDAVRGGACVFFVLVRAGTHQQIG